MDIGRNGDATTTMDGHTMAMATTNGNTTTIMNDHHHNGQ
jgi:hypothetical protein